MKLLEDIFIERHRLPIIALALPYVLALAWIDYRFGPAVSLAQGYLVAILIVAWTAGRWMGLSFSFLSIIAESSGDMLHESAIDVPQYLWRLSGHLLFYMLIVFMASSIKRSWDLERENARVDFLTGIANVRGFLDAGLVEIERARRSGYPVTVVYMDLDNFKKVNDTYGHMIGDSLLRRVAMILRNNTRVSDLTARMGGDEFALLLPGIRHEQAKLALGKLVNLLSGEMRKNQWPVTFSIGCVTFETTDHTLEDMLTIADGAMYEVKRNGKNNVAFRIDGTS